jgi:hypothetical protein
MGSDSLIRRSGRQDFNPRMAPGRVILVPLLVSFADRAGRGDPLDR